MKIYNIEINVLMFREHFACTRCYAIMLFNHGRTDLLIRVSHLRVRSLRKNTFNAETVVVRGRVSVTELYIRGKRQDFHFERETEFKCSTRHKYVPIHRLKLVCCKLKEIRSDPA